MSPLKKLRVLGSHQFIVLFSISLVLASIIFGVLLRFPAEPAESLTSQSRVGDGSSTPAPFVFHWQADTEYTYRVSFQVDGSLALAQSTRSKAQDPLSASLDLEGELVLRSYGKLEDGRNYVLGVRLERLKMMDWTLGMQPVLPEDGRSIVGPELALVVGPLGEFRSLNAAEEDSHALNLFRQMLAALEVVVAPGENSWTKVQTNPVGDVRMAYEVQESEPGTLSLERRPVHYSRLAVNSALVTLDNVDRGVTGEFSVDLDRIGHLKLVDGYERILVTRKSGEKAYFQETQIKARLLSVSRVEPGPNASQRLAGLSTSGLGDITTSEESRRRLLEQRIDGLTMDRLVRDLLIHGPAPSFPEAGRWMRRATGLLILHPELCRELIDVFEDPQMNHRGRSRVLDLLASTGHPEAQRVVRELLETPEARESNQYSMLLQRLSLVNVPTQETVDYLREKVELGDGEYTMAAAYSLGAALSYQREVDERSSALLRRGLEEASSTRERVAWLGALGNAGQTENMSLLTSHATDDDPGVRAAVAEALRKTQTPESETTLLALVADQDSDVQNRALHTLTRYSLAPDHLETLRQHVVSGDIRPTNLAMLMTVMENNRQQPNAVLPVLEGLIQHGVSDRRMLLRIRALQESLSSPR